MNVTTVENNIIVKQSHSVDELLKKVYIINKENTKYDILVWEQITLPTDETIKIMFEKFRRLAKSLEKFYFLVDIRKRETIGTANQRDKLSTAPDGLLNLMHCCVVVGPDRGEYKVYSKFLLEKQNFKNFTIHKSIDDAFATLVKLSE